MIKDFILKAQLGGMLYSKEGLVEQFVPNCSSDNVVDSARFHAIVTQDTSGGATFEPVHWPHSNAKLLLRLPHGRLSQRIDGNVQLTLTGSPKDFFLPEAFAFEAQLAANKLKEIYKNNNKTA